LFKEAAPALLVILFAMAISSNVASADQCTARLGYPIIPSVYANQIVTVVVPLSATCSIPYGNQIYATGTAYDLSTSTLADTENTVLTSVNSGYTFTGQLGFNLPASTQSHWMQISVTLYGGQSSEPLTTTGEAFPINPGTVELLTTTVTAQPTSYELAPTSSPDQNEQSHSTLAFVAIAAILVMVIIVTTGLIVYSRRPTGGYPAPYLPPSGY